MKYALIGITMVVALFLIIVVVAQESKQPGMGSAIGGGAEGISIALQTSPDLMGGKSRGKDAVLSKFTVVLGILFAVLCLVLGRYMNTF